MNCRRRTDAPTPRGRVQADNAKTKGTLYQGVAAGTGRADDEKPAEYKEVPVTPTTSPTVYIYRGTP